MLIIKALRPHGELPDESVGNDLCCQSKGRQMDLAESTETFLFLNSFVLFKQQTSVSFAVS